MGFGLGFLFKKKDKNEMQELLNEENIIMTGNFEGTDFVCLTGGTPEYIYREEFTLNSSDNTKLEEELAVRSGLDREEARNYAEHSICSPRIYMDTKGNFEFILEYDLDKEYDWAVTDKERELLINIAREHFKECFGVDLMKLPEMVKGCKNVEQLYDKFEIERGKGVEKVIKAYNLENMKVQGFDKANFNPEVPSMNTVLACTFSPDRSTGMAIRKEAGTQGKGSIECTAKFDNHMQMTLEVNDGGETKEIVPKRSLEKEIRAGISAMYEKNKGYSLAEYLFQNCSTETLFAKPTLEDMKYYCREMQKQKFFSEEMTQDFYNEDRLTDWAIELDCCYEDYGLTPLALHRELDYYKYPSMDTRMKLVQQINDYKVHYEEEQEKKKNGFYDNIDYDDESDIPF